MEAKQLALEAELAEYLQQASEVACRLQKLEQGRGTPRYDQIEPAAHEVLHAVAGCGRNGELRRDVEDSPLRSHRLILEVDL